MKPIRLLVAFSILLSLSCDPKKPNDNAAVSEAPKTLDPKVKIAQLEAELAVLEAMQAAVGVTVRESMKTTRKPGAEREKFVRPDSKKITVLFSANNHGERIDCGCKKRPLGGLARRKTMIDLANKGGEDQEKWWPKTPQSNTTFHVDAGDIFFNTPLASTGTPEKTKQALYDADSVAMGLKQLTYDAVNVGVIDLAFGIEKAQELYKKAGIEPISANLYKDGKRVFEPYKIVERDGFKVAFVGILKVKPRAKDYWTSRQLSVESADVAINTATKELAGKADAVIVLSNLGIQDTERLLAGINPKPLLAVVSNTNRLTQEPLFVQGVPMVEPMSRGKFFGRVDLVLNGDSVEFANGKKSSNDVLTSYGRSWRNYLAGRIRLNRSERQMTETEYELAARDEVSGTNNAPVPVLQDRLNKEKRRAEVLRKNRIGSSVTLEKEGREVAGLATQTATGDDFISTLVAAVDIKIPEDRKIKTIIDKREKKRPGAPHLHAH